MKSLDFGRNALYVCVAAALLQGCGGSQLPIAAPGAMSQSLPIATYRGSWMAPDAKDHNLLYVSDQGTGDVYVFVYRSGPDRIGRLVGKLAGVLGSGECVDQAGDVFITGGAMGPNIVEYSHGGTMPIATLIDTDAAPMGCSVDPTTGNLAVTNYATFHRGGSGPGNVAIYTGAKGSPEIYTAPYIDDFYFCGYDNKGNLFVDGWGGSYPFSLDEMPSGSSSFDRISLDQKVKSPGAVQWDGTYVAVGDQDKAVLYQFTVSGSNGTKVGSTPLMSSKDVSQFWIQGKNVIGADTGLADVGLWPYAAGGNPTEIKKLKQFNEPFGATVSLAPK
ncbi:MAG: hypothetical protein WAL67_05910 [Candidatus Cybelea sp.]